MSNTKALDLALMHIWGKWAKESPDRDVERKESVALRVFGVFMDLQHILDFINQK